MSDLEVNDSLLDLDDDELLEDDLKVFKLIKERRLMLLQSSPVIFQKLVDLSGLRHYYEYFTEWNESNFAPYHNWYHTRCMFLNCYEGAYYSKLDGSERRALLAAAIFHDFFHTAGKASDTININAAIGGLAHAHKMAKFRLLALTESELDLAVRCIEVTKYPYERRPELTVEKIIRDADLMQPYEENASRLLQQYRGLKAEIEVLHKKPYTAAEFANGNKDFLDKVEWHTDWARQKAEVRGWERVKSNLRQMLLD